jgi:hypothetical protein
LIHPAAVIPNDQAQTENLGYVGKEGFKFEKGECVFLPRLMLHAFAIRSPQIRLLALFSPAGLEGAFRSASSPAQNLELLSGALTYSKSGPKQIA